MAANPKPPIDLAGAVLRREFQKQNRKRTTKAKALTINHEAERALLASMMLDFGAYATCIDLLVPDDWDAWKNREVFEAICDVPRAEEGVVDIVSVRDQLKVRGTLAEVDQSYVSSVIESAVNWQNWREYLRIVLECSQNRTAQGIGALLDEAQISPEDAATRLSALVQRREMVLSGTTPPRRIGVLASEVQPEAVRWLWRRRLARGKLSIIDGDGGLGKGHITIDLAARKSAGRAFPGDMGISQEAGTVIIVSPEDDIADTLVPRLIAAKADLSRVIILNSIEETDAATGKHTERSVTIPRDVPLIEQLVTREHAELLMIDPILGCLDAGVKTSIDSEVRTALMPLKHMATRTGLCVLMVRHLNKSGGDNALYRGSASIAFSALCRTVLLVAEHPDNAGKRVLLPVKNNLSQAADGLTFSITSDDPDGVSWVSWEQEPCDLHPTDVLGNGAKRSAEAREVIEAMKSGTVNLPAKPSEIAAAMDSDGDEKFAARISKRLLRMAKSGLICSPAYGLYDLLPTTNNNKSNLSK